MESEPPGPRNERRLLIQREQKVLFEAMARVLITSGRYESTFGVYTPADRPEALSFRIDPDIALVKSIFYPDDDTFELDPGDVYLNYITPHTLDEEETDEPASSVYLHIGGRLKDSDVSFSVGYLITQEGNEKYSYMSEVDYEFSNDRRIIDEEIIEAGDRVIVVASYRRGLSRGDAERIHRLLMNI